MAKRDKYGGVKGAIFERVQAKNPVTNRWIKIDTRTGRIIDHKKSPGPYKRFLKKSEISNFADKNRDYTDRLSLLNQCNHFKNLCLPHEIEYFTG